MNDKWYRVWDKQTSPRFHNYIVTFANFPSTYKKCYCSVWSEAIIIIKKNLYRDLSGEKILGYAPWKKKNQKMAGSEQNIENLAFLLLPIPIKGNVSIVFVFFFVLEHWFKLCYWLKLLACIIWSFWSNNTKWVLSYSKFHFWRCWHSWQ